MHIPSFGGTRLYDPRLSALRLPVLAILAITAAGLAAPAGATDIRHEDQRLTWIDDTLPAGSRFGATVGLTDKGYSAFVGAPQGGGWASFSFEDGAWSRLESDIWTAVDPSFVTCSDDVTSGLRVLVATRDPSGSDQVQTMTPVPVDPYVSGIDNGDVRAIASAGTQLTRAVLAIGQPEVVSGNGRILIYEWDGADWVQTQVIVGTAGERLGSSLSFKDNQTLMAGAPGSGDNGAVRIYVDVGDWVEYQVIESPAIAQTDAGFGSALAAEGPWIAVGSPGWDRLLVNGGLAPDVGTVNLYRLVGLGWEHHSTLRPPEASTGDAYGTSVALREVRPQGGVLLVGAPNDSVDASGQGTAYVWWRHGDQWRARWRLAASSADADDHFGTSVALDPNGALVGAPDGDANGLDDQGEAYFFAGVVPLFYDGFESGDTAAWIWSFTKL